jgi:hypothetical protein
MWSALRALRERAAPLNRLGDNAESAGRGHLCASYRTRAREAHEQSDLIGRFIMEKFSASAADGAERQVG